VRILHWLEISNFKSYRSSGRIPLEHPSVLIGPNNCGKTTALQAIALPDYPA
jgi:predicted ATPase